MMTRDLSLRQRPVVGEAESRAEACGGGLTYLPGSQIEALDDNESREIDKER